MKEPPDHIRLDILADVMRKLKDVERAYEVLKKDLEESVAEELGEEIFNLRCLLDELSREATLSEDPYF